MPRYCCVPGCKSKGGGHKFPQDPVLRLKWRRAVRRMDMETQKLWEPGSEHVVCHKHFLPSDYNNTLLHERMRLKHKAVPSLFDFSTVESNPEVVASRTINTRRKAKLLLEAEGGSPDKEKKDLDNSVTPHTEMVTRGVTSQYRLRRKFDGAIELMMECQDEALTQSQVQAAKRAWEEYEKAKKMVEAAKAANLAIQQAKMTVSSQMQVRTGGHVSTPVLAKPGGMKPPSSSPDIIFVGESPPKSTTMAVSTASTVTTPVRVLPGTNPIPQQVYKFVNVQSGQMSQLSGNQWVIRPLMQVMPQQNSSNVLVSSAQSKTSPVLAIQKSPYLPRRLVSSSGQQQSQTTNSLVMGTSGLGVKRPLSSYENSNPIYSLSSPPKKKKEKKVVEMDNTGALVPLDEYYYGKKEGDPTYKEDHGEYRFKCWYCSKMLYNNVRTMMHMQGHINSEKQQNLDLSDLTQCKHCYKQFDTPFEMQTHVEKVHMNNANVLLCRICEKDHDSRFSLTSHMRQNHNACEMPYICQLCHFRSSMYSDVVDHFKKKHDSSEFLLCLYCLRIFHVKFVTQGWGQTQNYYHHLLRHQSKTNCRKCQLCKLAFFNTQDVKAHRKKDHLPNQKGVIGMNAKYTTPDQVMIRVPEAGLQPKQQGIKSLNAPAVSKIKEHRGLLYPIQVNQVYCFECKMIMGTQDHYRKYIECSMCRFATSCSFAYANHMMGFHSGQMTSLSLNIPWERPMPAPMYCFCGFGSRYGNKIANHLVFCSKRSCYKDKPDVQLKDDRDTEEMDPRRRPGASLLDVLGLVKKQNLTSKRRFSISPPRLRTPSPQPSTSQESQNTVPPMLTGAQRWLTVKLKDDKTPTKASVFLGMGESSFTDEESKDDSERSPSASKDQKSSPSSPDRENLDEDSDQDDKSSSRKEREESQNSVDYKTKELQEMDVDDEKIEEEEGDRQKNQSGESILQGNKKPENKSEMDDSGENESSQKKESSPLMAADENDVSEGKDVCEETKEIEKDESIDSDKEVCTLDEKLEKEKLKEDTENDVYKECDDSQNNESKKSESCEVEVEKTEENASSGSRETRHEEMDVDELDKNDEIIKEKNDGKDIGDDAQDKDDLEQKHQTESSLESSVACDNSKNISDVCRDKSVNESETKVEDSEHGLYSKETDIEPNPDYSLQKYEKNVSQTCEGGDTDCNKDTSCIHGDEHTETEDEVSQRGNTPQADSENLISDDKIPKDDVKSPPKSDKDRSSVTGVKEPIKDKEDKKEENSKSEERSDRRKSDRSNDREKSSRDQERSSSRDSPSERNKSGEHRSSDRDRSQDRARDRDRDRDRRDHHRSSDRSYDRDRHGGRYHDRHSGGEERRYSSNDRNYHRYQGGNQRDRGGYHGNQSHHQQGFRDNYSHHRDQNWNQGHHGNRDFGRRGRGQGYHGNYGGGGYY